MIERKTVLVLGAGSNVSYGFPTGQDLTQRILEEVHGEQGDQGDEVVAGEERVHEPP
mgnify:CR=1 FL=1